MNVATYGPGGRFTMTDRGRAALRQSQSQLVIGPSHMAWRNGRLEIGIDEFGAPPGFGRLRGRIVVTPAAVTGVELPLTDDGAHIWRPHAPVARIEVDLDVPGWRWTGEGYFDANSGSRALEADFDSWTWGRFPTPDGAVCFYDAMRRDGSTLQSAMAFDRRGRARDIPAPPVQSFGRNIWAVSRETRADAGSQPRVAMPMLDAPFYARTLVSAQIGGAQTTGVHEALNLRRFRSPLLMPMLACRVPRRVGWQFRD